MEVAVIEDAGKGFFEVLCRAEGGRPPPSITWIPDESADTQCSANLQKPESVSSSHCFPLDVYQGENITCVFTYPHLSAIERTVVLPRYCEYKYNHKKGMPRACSKVHSLPLSLRLIF